jgi:hypothetical protein
MRSEQEVFDDLATLCGAPGYLHALAFISYKDNYVGYANELAVEDMQSMFSEDRLIRTELCTLIGLLIKSRIDLARPDPQTIQEQIERTYTLLEELHRTMSGELLSRPQGNAPDTGWKSFSEGTALREPIFYSGESAYSFQYRDLSVKKYVNDSAWLQEKKGFSIEAAREVVLAVQRFQNRHLTDVLHSLPLLPPTEWTLVPGFCFKVGDISAESGIDSATVEAVLTAFVLPYGEHNEGFRAMHDFNVVYAYPLFRHEDFFVLLGQYNLVEALYDSPFYWMCNDKGYKDVAMVNRGRFTESFANERLKRVFGDARVYLNVNIQKSKTERAGEIDVLVLFGDRAIILQAKSKRLTLESRRGNDLQLRDDFKKSVQDAYDQACECAQHLTNPRCRLTTEDGKMVPSPKNLKSIYVFCVVSDHYPALTFQARQFLKYHTDSILRAPFVMDVFTLDALTEMLESPLQFLSYVDRRTKYSEKLLVPDELTTLSFHLRQNLWLDDKYDFVHLTDDISCDLDTAMTVRRDNVPGLRTPDGILTRLVGTTLWKILVSIEKSANPQILDLGFMLLTMSEDSFRKVSAGIDELVLRTRRDRAHHNMSTGSEIACEGFTVHCSYEHQEYATARLVRHCELRKYIEKASRWFGICIDPDSVAVRFGVNFDYKWKYDFELEENAKQFVDNSTSSPISNLKAAKSKIGRNVPCPCGSGLKYKKCCWKA